MNNLSSGAQLLSSGDTFNSNAFRLVIDSGLVGSGEVSRGEKMALRGTDPESYITECTLASEDKQDSGPIQFSWDPD